MARLWSVQGKELIMIDVLYVKSQQLEKDWQLKEAKKLLEEAVNLFVSVHELCDDVGSEEWIWKWCIKGWLHDN